MKQGTATFYRKQGTTAGSETRNGRNTGQPYTPGWVVMVPGTSDFSQAKQGTVTFCRKPKQGTATFCRKQGTTAGSETRDGRNTERSKHGTAIHPWMGGQGPGQQGFLPGQRRDPFSCVIGRQAHVVMLARAATLLFQPANALQQLVVALFAAWFVQALGELCSPASNPGVKRVTIAVSFAWRALE